MNQPDDSDGLTRVFHQMRTVGKPRDGISPLHGGVDTRGYLPHVKKEGAWYFVTFRLADSLPQSVLAGMEQELAHAAAKTGGESQSLSSAEIQKARQRKIERYLDEGAGECWLRRPEIASMVADALLYFNGDRYQLDEWVIMPNHVHLVIRPLANYSLSNILHSRKRLIARDANKILARTGESFWQPESYDHWIRSEDELLRIREYIRQNPVKGGLSRSPEEWQWGSAWRESGKRLPDSGPNA